MTKFIYLDSNAQLAEKTPTTTSVGATQYDVVGLNSLNQIDSTLLPTGYGAEVIQAPASENLPQGSIVNVWNNSGVSNVRNADASASSPGKKAHGFVLAATASGQTATVYIAGINNALSGLTIGAEYYLSDTTPGAITLTPPTTVGHLKQRVGVATSTSSLPFIPESGVFRG